MGELLTFLATLFMSSSAIALDPFNAFPEDSSQNLPAQYFEVTPPAPFLKTFVPIMDAPEALILDVSSGGTIWAKNAHEKRAIASLTKLMVALITLENHTLTEKVQVPADFVAVEGAKMRVEPGEVLTIETLLKGLLIPSGNDAAQVLAIYHSGSEEKFVGEMNIRAALLGMKDTHFVNVHGLDADEHFSTASDLGILARKVLEFPVVRSIARTRQEVVQSVDGSVAHDLNTTNDLLFSAFPIMGLKTGTTEKAGQCLITLLQGANHEFLVIILGSENRFYDTKVLLSPLLERSL
jgi:D-alanyl-D-alanine carboxypeptidase (penicillin-binding protein 5/6)